MSPHFKESYDTIAFEWPLSRAIRAGKIIDAIENAERAARMRAEYIRRARAKN